MKKEILLGMFLIGQNISAISLNINNAQSQEIFDNFEKHNSTEKTYQCSSDRILEILQDNIKQQIIQGTLVYFEKDVTCTLTDQEKTQLKNDMGNYIKKYPNIIKISGNNIVLDLNDDNFRELFKTLLPYLGRGNELRDYPNIIKSNDKLLIRHITKSKGSDAEKYFFHQFGYLIMRIVEQMPGDMTIGYYRGQMLKVVPNKYIANKDYSNISNLSITELSKYF